MGLPFGIKEIQVALPDLRTAQPTPPNTKKPTTTADISAFRVAQEAHVQSVDLRTQDAET